MTATETNDKMLARVRALLAKADGTNFPEEADAFRAKADALMTQYAIEQWMIDADTGEGRPEPVRRDYDMSWYASGNNRSSLYSIMLSVSFHCRVKIVYWKYDFSNEKGWTIPIVGLQSDINYFDMLFTSLSLELSKGLEPKPDPKQPMIENLVRMKEAGMKWERIGELLYGIGQLDAPYTRNTGVRFTKLYTDYCTEHNRPRLRTSPVVYQRSFSQGFCGRMRERLSEIRREGDKVYDKDHSSTGMEIALRDMSQVINDKVNELFGAPPQTRGGRGRAVARDVKVDYNAVSDGVRRADSVQIANNPGERIGSRRQIEG